MPPGDLFEPSTGDPYAIEYKPKLAPLYDEPLSPRIEFPMEAFPPVVQAILRDVDHHKGFPPEASAQLVYGTIAIAIQGRCVLQAREGWLENLSHWCLVEAGSGARKSAARSQIMKPLNGWLERENQRRELYNGAVEQRYQEMAKDKDNPMTKPEAAKKIEKYSAPPFAFEARTGTIEGATKEAARQWGNFAIVTSEGSSVEKVINGLYSDKGSDVSALLDGHTGDSINVVLSQSEHRYSPSSAISLVLLGQGNVTEKFAGNEDLSSYGFFSRMFYCRVQPRERSVVAHGDPVNTPAWDDWRDLVDAVCDGTPWPESVEDAALGAITSLGPSPWPRGYEKDERVILRWTPEASELYVHLERQVEALLSPRGASEEDLVEINDFKNKIHGLVGRVAAYQHALHEPQNYWKEPVPEDRLREAIEVVRYYLAGWDCLMPSGRDLVSLRAESKASSKVRGAIMRWIGRQEPPKGRKGVVVATASQMEKAVASRDGLRDLVPGVIEDLGREYPGGMTLDSDVRRKQGRSLYTINGALLEECRGLVEGK
jgi:hypothetical protein